MRHSRPPDQRTELPFFPFSLKDCLLEQLERLPDPKGRKVTIGIERIRTIACIYHQLATPAIVLHPILNHESTPREVIEHIIIHELLHLRIPGREIDGRHSAHPPEFFEAEREWSPQGSKAWCWVHIALGGYIRRDKENEKIWVKRTWRQALNTPYPSLRHCWALNQSKIDFTQLDSPISDSLRSIQCLR